jgi:nucleotide-binding universal stress UspA family protein
MTCIIVGTDGSGRSADAVTFAGELARTSRAKLMLACAHHYDGPLDRAAGADHKTLLKANAEARVESDRLLLGDLEDVETRSIEDLSPPQALHMLADVHAAGLVVIGSSHRGAAGRVLAGTTAERLLHGAPCSVAVVPRGWRDRPSHAIRTIGVAYDASDESKAALSAGVAAARAFDAALQVVQVLEPGLSPGAAMGVPGYITPPGDVERHARDSVEGAVAGLPQDVRAEGVLAIGEAVHELALHSEDLDLLIVGSRGYGPHRAVLVGSVSGRLVRKAACPVVVVPRGIKTPFEKLLAGVAGVAGVAGAHAG